jgi:CubicO group peptidase (beta-lactamase class C family)
MTARHQQARGRRRWGVKALCLGAVLALALVFTLGTPFAGASSAPTDYQGVIAKLNAEIPKLMKTGGTVGLTIALVDGNRTVWKRGFGWADRARRIPVTANTLFHIGSVAKTMSAVAVMQLVQEGLVELHAPLAHYVPGFSLLPRYHNSVITVESVLDHHSGIPGSLGNGLFTENRPDPGYRAWLLKTLRTEYPERPVNTAWAYDNSAYVLVQNLVEHVTGQGFLAYTRQHLFGPMRMRSTTYDDASVPAARLTNNYEAIPDNGTMRVIPKPREYCNGWAAGSVVSSATDMAAYLKTMIAGGAVPGGRILRASTVRAMITPQTNLPLDIAPFRMGLGWWVGESGLSWMGTVIHHAGHTLANHSDMLWLPGSKLGVFVSVNTQSPVDVEHQVAVLALGLMVTAKTGRTAPAPPKPSPRIHVSTAVLRRAAGRYADAAGLELVRAGRGVLVLTVASQRPNARSMILTPRADGWYTDRSGSVSIRPKTVEGRRLMLGRMADGAVGAVFERIPSGYHVPAVWHHRIGNYRAVNIHPNTYPGTVAHEAALTLGHGILIWHAAPGVARETSVLAPAGPHLAFTLGFAPFAVETNAGDGVVAGKNTLTFLGVTYRRTGT